MYLYISKDGHLLVKITTEFVSAPSTFIFYQTLTITYFRKIIMLK